MKILNIQNNFNTNLNNNKRNITPTFQGLSFRTPSTRVRIYDSEQYIREACSYMSNLIGQPAEKIIQLTEGANKNRFAFFTDMATQYKIRNHNLANNLKDDSEHLLQIYKMVENPTPAHFNIIDRTQGSFRNAEEMFKLANDERSLGFIQTMQHEVLDGKTSSSKTIIDMLSSKNREAYIEHPENYTSYLKLHSAEADSIEILDRLIADGTYRKETFDAHLAVDKLLKNRNVNSVFGEYKDELRTHYSPEGTEFLSTLVTKIVKKESLDKETKNIILDMYKTVTPENSSLRTDIINKFNMPFKKSKNISEDIKELKKLFDRIDTNTNVRAFIDKAVRKDLHVNSPKEFNDILETVPAKMAEMFMTNLKRIVSMTEGQTRKTALINELQNPLYVPANKKVAQEGKILYGGAEHDSIISKAKRYIESKINTYRYNRLGIEEKPLAASKNVRPLKHTVKFNIINSDEAETAINLVNTAKESREARKLKVISDVNNIIKQRLHEKTFARQQEIYSENATKMRLKLLPEIFNSIKETRQADRINGKKKSASSNTDAIKLYKLINGKTRKLVRYMLLKRDNNGEKLFEVKDIINYLNKHNSITDKNKKLYGATAEDTKFYYNELFTDMIEKHGKLTGKECKRK